MYVQLKESSIKRLKRSIHFQNLIIIFKKKTKKKTEQGMQNLTFEISLKCVNMVDINALWEKISFFSKYVIFQSAYEQWSHFKAIIRPGANLIVNKIETRIPFKSIKFAYYALTNNAIETIIVNCLSSHAKCICTFICK